MPEKAALVSVGGGGEAKKCPLLCGFRSSCQKGSLGLSCFPSPHTIWVKVASSRLQECTELIKIGGILAGFAHLAMSSVTKGF